MQSPIQLKMVHVKEASAPRCGRALERILLPTMPAETLAVLYWYRLR